MRSHFSNLWTSSFESLSKSRISILRWRYIPCRWPCDLGRLPTVCARNLLIAWMSYRNEPRVTFIWKKCQGSKMKSNKLNKKGRKVKVAQGLTHTSWTSGTNQTNVSLFWGDPGTSITYLNHKISKNHPTRVQQTKSTKILIILSKKFNITRHEYNNKPNQQKNNYFIKKTTWWLFFLQRFKKKLSQFRLRWKRSATAIWNVGF